jgi:hypothetical protein
MFRGEKKMMSLATVVDRLKWMNSDLRLRQQISAKGGF